jgi:hypothetical protein
VDDSATLTLTQLGRGTTSVTVTASDGEYAASRTFSFSVSDVDKVWRWAIDVVNRHAITVTNTSSQDVAFTLHNNGFALATSGADLVSEFASLPDAVPQEGLHRKLWRGVRDGTYHWAPITASYWAADPLLLLNSIGFGLCGQVASALGTLGHVAGYHVQSWDLKGHIVTELQVAGRWELYDPDLGVYYLDREGRVAGVGELELDPTLVSSPQSPQAETSWTWPYSQTVADIYSASVGAQTNTRNSLIPFSFPFYAGPRETEVLHLPAGASMTYPGQWSASVTGNDGTAPHGQGQLALDLPPGFAGTIDVPLLLWDVQGSGRVRIGGVEYLAGSAEVSTMLHALNGPINGVEIEAGAGSVRLVYLVNPIRLGLRSPGTELRLSSASVWALDAQLSDLSPDEQPDYTWWISLTRPTE